MRLTLVLSVLILSSLYNQTSAQMPAPNVFEAALDKGKTFYKSKQYQAAEEAFRKIIRQSPHLPRAYHWLGLVFSAQGRDEEAGEQLLQAEQAYTHYIAQLDTTDQRLFEDLTYVTSEDNFLDSFQEFWASRDPDPLTPVNERLLEHYRRIIYARENFSHNQSPWDERGDVYIRYGEPDDQQRLVLERIIVNNNPQSPDYLSKVFLILDEDLALTGDAQIDMIRDIFRGVYRPPNSRYYPPALSRRSYFESWVYVRLKQDFYFLAPYFASPFEFPPVLDGAMVLPYHPTRLANELIDRMPEDYAYNYGGEPLDTVFDLVTFKGMKHIADTYVLYNVPLRQLGTPKDGLGMETWITCQIALQDSLFQTVHRFSQPQGPVPRPLLSRNDPRSLVASLSFMASAGTYQAVVKIQDKITRRLNILKKEVQIPNYTGEALMVSDILLATAINSATSSGSVTRNGLKISPSISHIYHRKQPLYLYYEVYNLPRDHRGETAFRTAYEITPAQSKGSKSLEFNYEVTGRAVDEFQHTSIDLIDLKPGEYTLTVQVTDLHTQITASRSTHFLIKK